MQSDDELRSIVATYISDVLEGRRIVGRLERLAVERHVRDLGHVRKKKRKDWRFDEDRALVPLRFACGVVHLRRGPRAGEDYRFCSRTAWIAFVYWCLWGWLAQREDKSWAPRFDECYLSTARQNGKSLTAAIPALLLYVAGEESSPEIYTAATQREQSAIVWKKAAGIVKGSPLLRRQLRVKPSSYTIAQNDDLEATFRALSRNDDEFDGFSPVAVVLDEVHAHPDSGMYDVLRSGMVSRVFKLRLLTTTRGARSESFCGDYERTAIQVLEGIVEEDSTFVFIACLDEGDDWADEAAWPKANPSIGVTVTVEELRKECQRAKNNTTKLVEFKRKNCNLWTVGRKGWLPIDVWDRNADQVEEKKLAGAVAYAAVDLSKSSDYTAAVVVALLPDGIFAVRPHFWIPEVTMLERSKTDKVPVLGWQAEELLTATPGEIVDQDFVKAWLHEQSQLFDLREMTFDPAQSWKLCAELEAEGLDNVTHFPQAWKNMHSALKETEDLLRLGRVCHGGHPILRWMFSNVAIRENATGLRRPDKAKSEDRIDGITALVMAIGRAVSDSAGPSIYETRDPVMVG